MIFLHSSFRVSSTWLWACFRRSDRVIAYFEIFNEQLASITVSEASSFQNEGWLSKHPVVDPYFLEFQPLIKDEGGVRKYDSSMAYDSFLPIGGLHGVLRDGEREYVASLIDHAERLGKIPVLSCSRSLGRLRALKTEFSGLHILLYRNLFQQWCSYTEQLFHQNDYFFYSIRMMLGACQDDHFCRELLAKFPLDSVEVGSENYFICFIFLHLYFYAQNAGAADYIIDVNRLAGDDAYRYATERLVAGIGGVAIDLSDVKESIAFSFIKLGSREEFMRRIEPIADIVISGAPTALGRDFAAKALAEVVHEYAQYQFYTNSLRAIAEAKGLFAEAEPGSSPKLQ